MRKISLNCEIKLILNAVVCTVFAGTTSLAVEVQHKNGNIYLSAATCAELKVEIDAIVQWKNLREGTAFLTPLIDCEKNPVTQFDVTNLLPKNTKSIYQRKYLCDGPNCWNSTLIDAGFLGHARFVDLIEWDHYLKKCKQRKYGEKPKPGDIGSMVLDGESIHGFIYISDNLLCSKNGNTTKSIYELQPFKNVQNQYQYSRIDYYYDCDTTVSTGELKSSIKEFEALISCCVTKEQCFDYSKIKNQLASFDTLVEAPVLESYKEQLIRLDDLYQNRIRYVISRRNVTVQDVENLLPFLGGINRIQFYGYMTVLDAAVKEGRFEIVKMLIDKGAQPTLRTLNFAAEGGSFEVTKFLVERFPQLLETSTLQPGQDTPLHSVVACSSQFDKQPGDRMQIVKLLIEKAPWLLEEPFLYGRLELNPAELAVDNDYSNIVEFLQSKGLQIRTSS